MNLLKLLWHKERMAIGQLWRIIVGRGRPQRSWMDELKELLMEKGLSEREGMVLGRDRKFWVRVDKLDASTYNTRVCH